MGTLVVRRPEGGWRDFARTYRIKIDGRNAGRLWRGQSLTVQVPVGRHAVSARIDWNGSPDVFIDVWSGSCTRLRVEPSGGAWMAAWQVIGSGRWLTLSVES